MSGPSTSKMENECEGVERWSMPSHYLVIGIFGKWLWEGQQQLGLEMGSVAVQLQARNGTLSERRFANSFQHASPAYLWYMNTARRNSYHYKDSAISARPDSAFFGVSFLGPTHGNFNAWTIWRVSNFPRCWRHRRLASKSRVQCIPSDPALNRIGSRRFSKCFWSSGSHDE